MESPSRHAYSPSAYSLSKDLTGQMSKPQVPKTGGVWNSKTTARGRLSITTDRDQPPKQLKYIRHQWNAERDIPSGAVRNNPFLPKREPSPPPSPQLLHQRRQWDTGDIPRGSVASRTSMMENGTHTYDECRSPGGFASPRSTNSPRRYKRNEEFESRIHPPGKTTKTSLQPRTSIATSSRSPSVQPRFRPPNPGQVNPRTSVAPVPVPSMSITINSTNKKNGGHRGQVPSQFLPMDEKTRPFSNRSKWKPSQEIPLGAVSGRVSSLSEGRVLESTAKTTPSPQKLKADEDDPWILSSPTKAPFSAEEWGEAAQAKSEDSEEWNATDWLQASNNKDIISEQKVVCPSHGDLQSVTKTRDDDVVQCAKEKKEILDTFGEPFAIDGARDMDILMAAKKKSVASSPKRGSPFLATSSPLNFPSSEPDASLVATQQERGISESPYVKDEFTKLAFPDDDAFGSFFSDMESNEAVGPSESEGDKSVRNSRNSPRNNRGEEFDTDTTTPAIMHQTGNCEDKKDRKGFFKMFSIKKSGIPGKPRTPRFSFGSGRGRNPPNPPPGNLDNQSDPTKFQRPGEESSNANESYPLEEGNSKDKVFTAPKTPEDTRDIWDEPPSTSSMADKESVHCESLSEDDGNVEYRVEGSEGEEDMNSFQESCPSEMVTFPSSQAEVMMLTGEVEANAKKEHLGDVTSTDVEDPELNHVSMNDSSDSDSEHSSRENVVSVQKDWIRPRPSEARRRKAQQLRRPEASTRNIQTLTTGDKVKQKGSIRSSRYGREIQERTMYYGIESPQISVSRHAQIRSNLVSTKVSKLQDGADLVRAESGASSSRRQISKARNYARQRAGFSNGSDELVQSSSTGSDESRTLASIGSDIRILRSIVRRPKKSPSTEIIGQSEQQFPAYDLNNFDPMQHAGLRMLSAAIIPMQAQVRRFLAMRQALTRMWALIIIQTYTRRWIARKNFTRTVKATIAIQAITRGKLVRDDLDFKHVCAIEIQRMTRGYMATMRVYEDIYKVTMVQSIVRRKQAMDQATLKLAYVIQLQSIVRGFLTRRQQEYEHICAVAIQSNWRCFYNRLNYQFDLLDIIITQSVWRRMVAIRKYKLLKESRTTNAAIVIQTKWRQHDCKMTYLQDQADILVAQSAIRRFLAVQRANRVRHKDLIRCQAIARGYLGRRVLERHFAARKIQSAWRGFVCYADYMFCVADIVTVQKISRAWLAKRAADRARTLRLAATTIQCACRVMLSKSKAHCMAEVRELERRGREIAEKEERAAICIQSFIRCGQTRKAFIAFLAARKIQAFWRCKNLCSAYKFYHAAVKIQASFRAMKTRQDVVILRGEVLAATMIQSAWRGFLAYTDYVFIVSDIITVQRVARGYVTRQTKGQDVSRALEERRAKVRAAVVIQKNYRGLMTKQRYWYTLGCTMQVQSWMRGRLVMLRLRREESARLKLQSFARRYLARQEYVQRKFLLMLIQTAEKERSKKVAALVIQEKARHFLDDKRKHEAATVIQHFFVSVRNEVDQIVKATKRRQKWRKIQSDRHRDEGEDNLLEDAWMNAVSDSNIENTSAFTPSLSTLGSNTCRATNTKVMDHVPKKRDVKKNRLPPTSGLQHSGPRVGHQKSEEYSLLTGATATFYRMPPARSRKMNAKEMRDDLELEEAFMDTAIGNAKQRRLSNRQSVDSGRDKRTAFLV